MTDRTGGLALPALPIMVFLFGCSVTVLLPGHSTVLPGSAAQELSRPCSRPGPPLFSETWQPSEEDIANLEAKLRALQGRRAGLCCLLGAKLRDPGMYYRQYLGIVVDGKKVIYVNAFEAEQPPASWRTEPVDYCDGGTASWGAVFDPAGEDFRGLAFNGVA